MDQSYPIPPDTALKIIDSTPPSLKFATEARQRMNGTCQGTIGFDRIPEAREVYKMIRKSIRGEKELS